MTKLFFFNKTFYILNNMKAEKKILKQTTWMHKGLQIRKIQGVFWVELASFKLSAGNLAGAKLQIDNFLKQN